MKKNIDNYYSRDATQQYRGSVIYRRISGSVIYKHGSYILKAALASMKAAVAYRRIRGLVLHKHASLVLKAIFTPLALAIVLSPGTAREDYAM